MYIKARVYSQSKNASLETKDDVRFVIKVKEKAEGNRANTRAREMLAEHFKIPLPAVRIVSGHHSPSKLFSINK
jgi:uncharacterized protein YggU (UPF0235/DUF167 family)